MSNRHKAIIATMAAAKPSPFPTQLTQLREGLTALFAEAGRSFGVTPIDNKPIGEYTHLGRYYNSTQTTIDATDGTTRKGYRDARFTYVKGGTFAVIHARYWTRGQLGYNEDVHVKVRNTCDLAALRTYSKRCLASSGWTHPPVKVGG